jgi:voltage-gated potassium channel Kch
MLMLQVVAAVAAVLVIAIVLWDVFETVVLPRRVSRRVRLARAYFRSTWRISSALIGRLPGLERREAALAVYGPIAILGLLAFWVMLLIAAYGLLLWGLGSPLTASHGATSFGTDLYYSGTTLLTLGLGDVVPRTGRARFITVVEVATGFGMLALVIGYLPILYQAFSRREVLISLLDAHAGSPPTAGTLLLRHPPDRRDRRLTSLLAGWEGWAAELLETHLSYPVLAYYRSQHENQSWVAALGLILDACTLVLACECGLGGDDELAEQAAFTFAIARHTAVDLAQVFHQRRANVADTDKRLPPAERVRLRDILTAVGAAAPSAGMGAEGDVVGRVDSLRALYEPYLEALAEFLLMPLPPWVPEPGALDDWQTTADEVTAPSITELVSHQPPER